ncbi:MAG: restriction endonuclease [Roseovarius sp.]|nr:restriction endonuclease [Roseovarius sp.]
MTDTAPLGTIDVLDAALDEIKKQSSMETDGKWLEHLTVKCGPLIVEWNLETCICWDDWKDEDRPHFLRGVGDCGIDAVGIRADNSHVAIQTKSRKLDEQGKGADIAKLEVNKFLAAAHDEFWTEHFLVTNGDVKMASAAEAAGGESRPIKLINLVVDLVNQKNLLSGSRDGGGIFRILQMPVILGPSRHETTCRRKPLKPVFAP